MPVKEQRVEGYSVFPSPFFIIINKKGANAVRCTLVAGKPVLGRKHIYSSSKFKVYSALFHSSTTIGKSWDMISNQKN